MVLQLLPHLNSNSHGYLIFVYYNKPLQYSQVAVKKTIVVYTKYKVLKFKLIIVIVNLCLTAFQNSSVNNHVGIIVTLKFKRIIESNLHNMYDLCKIVSSTALDNPNDSRHVLYYCMLSISVMIKIANVFLPTIKIETFILFNDNFVCLY